MASLAYKRVMLKISGEALAGTQEFGLSTDVVSFIAGYPFKKDSETTLEIGGKPFKLFTDGETAWARDSDTDKTITAALRDTKGKPMVVKGTSARGTKTTDTYSLDGVTQAYDAMNQACGVKR